MAIITGGVIEGWGAPRAALEIVMREVRQFKLRQRRDDYAVDIAFLLRGPREEPEFTGVVRAGPVGRRQRRSIVWHALPAALDDPVSVRAWLAGVLPETAALVRQHLPRRSKAYPSEELAAEIEQLRDALLQHR